MKTVEEVVAAYVKLRDKLTAMQAEHKEAEAVIDEKLVKLRAWLLKKSEETGVDSFKTEAGTAYKTTKDKAGVADRDAFLKYVLSEEATELLPASVNKTAVRDYIKEHGEPPPGVTYTKSFDINVNRPRKKKGE